MKEAGITRIFTENVRDFLGMSWVEAVNPLVDRNAGPGKGRRKAIARADGA